MNSKRDASETHHALALGLARALLFRREAKGGLLLHEPPRKNRDLQCRLLTTESSRSSTFEMRHKERASLVEREKKSTRVRVDAESVWGTDTEALYLVAWTEKRSAIHLEIATALEPDLSWSPSIARACRLAQKPISFRHFTKKQILRQFPRKHASIRIYPRISSPPHHSAEKENCKGTRL